MDGYKIQNVFLVSDSTGITVDSLGQSLFTQFPNIQFEKTVFPFVSNENEAKRVITHIQNISAKDKTTPIVFSSLANEQLKNLFLSKGIPIIDIFSTFIPAMESQLNAHASHAIGETHGVSNSTRYIKRIDALNYTLSHDDGMKISNMESADIILTGVSRSGKTPTCLYLAMHYNLKAANYPLVDNDLDSASLPQPIADYKNRLFGLTISPKQLSKIRQERRPSSKYSSLSQCELEIKNAENIFLQSKIPYLDTTTISIEEIATSIIQRLNIKTQGKW